MLFELKTILQKFGDMDLQAHNTKAQDDKNSFYLNVYFLSIPMQLNTAFLFYERIKEKNFIIIQMSKHQNLESLSSNELKAMLRQLQSQHDILQAKNQQMSNHINDMRNLVKKVENERAQQLDFMLKKKDKLGNEIQSLREALKVCHSSEIKKYEQMLAYKILHGGK